MTAMKMPFGKYRGRDVTTVPHDYLDWCLWTMDCIRPALLALFQEILKDDGPPRDAAGRLKKTEQHEAYTAPKTGTTSSTLETDVLDVVDQWVRRMARNHHPDRGGNNEVMAILLSAGDELKKMLKDRLKRL